MAKLNTPANGMDDLKPFKHGQEGTHFVCDVRFREYGSNALCCECFPHEGCGYDTPTKEWEKEFDKLCSTKRVPYIAVVPLYTLICQVEQAAAEKAREEILRKVRLAWDEFWQGKIEPSETVGHTSENKHIKILRPEWREKFWKGFEEFLFKHLGKESKAKKFIVKFRYEQGESWDQAEFSTFKEADNAKEDLEDEYFEVLPIEII